MPRRNTHILVAVPSGTITACLRGSSQQPVHVLLEGIGGGLGAWLGAQSPDIAEPASLGWNHRSLCHSWSTLIAALAAAPTSVSKWEEFCRDKANVLERLRLSGRWQSEFGRLLLLLQEMLWRIAAGILAGFIVGYVSHLTLDSFSERGLPLVA
jgi:membrane-bound metal-dependent hydrolase YbcI (DUF457 family)